MLAALLAATPALADTSATIGLGTDYVSRGTSQTIGKPAVTIYAEHSTDSGLYFGVFAANVDFDDGTKIEADPMVGYRDTVAGVNVDIGAIYVTYYGKQKTNWNMVEAHVALSKTIKDTTISTYVGVSPDYFNYAGRSVWVETTVSKSLSEKISASGAVGFQYIQKDIDYFTWNAGVTYAVTPTLSLDARYYDSDWKKLNVEYLDKIYAPRVMLTLRKTI